MPRAPETCWLHLPDGGRVEVDPQGVVVGRGLGSDIVLVSEEASRRHAIVYLDTDGPRLVPLGNRPCRVQGRPVRRERVLHPGDRLGFPGLELRVVVERSADSRPSGWVLRCPGQGFVEIPTTPLRLGGSPEDAVRIPGWPEDAVRVTCRDGAPVARIAAGIALNGEREEQPVERVLAAGDRLEAEGRRVQVFEVGLADRTTLGATERDLPVRVRLQPLPPAGGQVFVATRRREGSAYVPGRRFELLQVLLQPGKRYRPGDPIPDAVVVPRIWGRSPPNDPQAVTTVTRRLRKDLVRLGVDGRAVLHRFQYRTRFVLAEGATVEVLEPR